MHVSGPSHSQQLRMTEYTVPNISPSAVHRVEGKGGAAAQRWYVVWSHIWTSPGLTEHEVNDAELNNNLQAHERAIFTEYSRIIILNFLLFSLNVWDMFETSNLLYYFIIVFIQCLK